MKPDLQLVARLYCALIAGLLIALGISTWADADGNLYIGGLLCGCGLFMVAGLFGRATRLLAMLGLCAAFTGLAFAFSLGSRLLAFEMPTSATLGVWALELMAGGIAAALARGLYLDSLRGA